MKLTFAGWCHLETRAGFDGHPWRQLRPVAEDGGQVVVVDGGWSRRGVHKGTSLLIRCMIHCGVDQGQSR